jgi:Peptidase family C25
VSLDFVRVTVYKFHQMRSSQHSSVPRKIAAVLVSIALTCLPWLGFELRANAQANSSSANISFAGAVAGAKGVLLEWRSSDPNNLGFNIYRVQKGQRTRINGELIGGGIFRGVRHVDPGIEQSYSWLDRSGTADSTYEIESVGLMGELRTYSGIKPIRNERVAQSLLGANAADQTGAQNAALNEFSFPGSSRPSAPAGAVEDQWVIASRFGLKIHIKADGWYRVTQQQMAAAGFNPTVDIRNLALFGDGKEVPIRTSKDVGTFVSGDYIEFYARGLDTPTADTRIYYLLAGTSRGKRIEGDLRANGTADPPKPLPSPAPSPLPQQQFSWLLNFHNGPERSSTSAPAPANSAPSVQRQTVQPPQSVAGGEGLNVENNVARTVGAKKKSAAVEDKTVPEKTAATAKLETKEPPVRQEAVTPQKAAPRKKSVRKRARWRKKARRNARHHRNHFDIDAAGPSFDTTVLIKERYDVPGVFHPIYFVSLLNGDTENYFGRVLGASTTYNVNAPNPELTADGPAKLEFAIQGILNQIGSSHSINVEFNGTQVGSYSFGPLDYLLRKIDIPVNLLVNGNNTVKFIKTSTGEACLVDYLKLTYPHSLKADSNSLRFTQRFAVAAKIDGFSSTNVRLIDYTDPFAVKISRPAVESTAAGYAITVPTGPAVGKGRRLLFAALDTQFDQPAALSLNQPSTLNAATNGADLLIITTQSLISSAAPLVAQRQSQGLSVSVVDIEDVYDEFSFGAHGPQAIKDFLNRASLSWTTKPQYVILLGDASLDPRNYEAVGNFDLVPTKLVDATYNETASDDWLSDFDNDGIANIPTGRIPARTVAEANLIISKIVNFVPSNAPQTALLVADDFTSPPYYFNFEIASDRVGALLPAGMTLQKVYRRTQPSTCAARAAILNVMGQGAAVINYSGHGSVNVWAGVCPDPNPNLSMPFFQTGDAQNLQNNNKLPIVFVSNCLNGYFQDPRLDGIAEGFVKAQNGGAFAVFASSGETIPDGQQEMSEELYRLLYGPQSIRVGDAIKLAKGLTNDIDVRRTWVFFGDPSMKIR